MNPTSTPDTQEVAHLEKLRMQISTDIEVMHQKEASLKEYEQRLRLLVEQVQHAPVPHNVSQNYVTSGPNSQASLDSEWEKYDRAHALLEAARRGLTDDRMALKDREERVTAREVEATKREAWIKVREQELAVVAQAQAQAASAVIKAKPSFTTAPFLAAKNLFSHGKST